MRARVCCAVVAGREGRADDCCSRLCRLRCSVACSHAALACWAAAAGDPSSLHHSQRSCGSRLCDAVLPAHVLLPPTERQWQVNGHQSPATHSLHGPLQLLGNYRARSSSEMQAPKRTGMLSVCCIMLRRPGPRAHLPTCYCHLLESSMLDDRVCGPPAQPGTAPD